MSKASNKSKKKDKVKAKPKISKAPPKPKLKAKVAAKPATKAAKPKGKPASVKTKVGAKVATKSSAKSKAPLKSVAQAKPATKAVARSKEIKGNADVPAKVDLKAELKKQKVAAKAKAKSPKEEVVEELDITIEVEGDPEEVVLTDAEGRRYCKVKDCDQLDLVDGYCRYHYLLLWKRIQTRKKILADGKLERYIEDLTSRYPDKYIEMIRKDLRTEKDFASAIQELEIDDSNIENEYEEEAQSLLEEVRGMGTGGGRSSGRDDDEF